MSTVSIPIARVGSGNEDIPLPSYVTPGASGMDIFAAPESDLVVRRGEIVLVPTGFQIAVPAGYEAQIRPRSGLALRQGIAVLNSPGTIDSDYRGEVKIILANFGPEDVPIRRGDRIAQMVICPVVHAELRVVPELDATRRGSGGFGHTGV